MSKLTIASKLRKSTLGTVPWIAPFRDGLEGDRLTIVDGIMTIDPDGDYVYTEIPVPNPSSNSRLVWESINQQVLMLTIGGYQLSRSTPWAQATLKIKTLKT